GRDAGEAKDRRIDDDDVRHRDERRRAAEHLPSNGRAGRLEAEGPVQARALGDQKTDASSVTSARVQLLSKRARAARAPASSPSAARLLARPERAPPFPGLRGRPSRSTGSASFARPAESRTAPSAWRTGKYQGGGSM